MSAGDLTLFAGGSDWSPSSWRAKPALQQPAWPDEAELEQATKALRDLPPLVFAMVILFLQWRPAGLMRAKGR